MECQSCGRSVAVGDRFCNGCGAPLATTAAAAGNEPSGTGDVANDTANDTANGATSETANGATSETANGATSETTGGAPGGSVAGGSVAGGSVAGGSGDEPWSGGDPTGEVPVIDAGALDGEATAVIDITGAEPEQDAGERAATQPTAALPAEGSPATTPTTTTTTTTTDALRPPMPSSRADDPETARPEMAPPTAPRPAASDPAATELITIDGGDDTWGDIDPVWAATGPIPSTPAPASPTSAGDAAGDTGVGPATGSVGDPLADPVDAAPTTTVSATPASASSTATMPVVVAADSALVVRPRRPRATAVSVFGLLATIAAIAVLGTNLISIQSNVPLDLSGEIPFGFRPGGWILSDLADNLPVAFMLAALTMATGAAAATWGWRWGAGLAGGSGAAMAGLAALTIGLAQYPIDAAREFALIPPQEPFDPFVLTITREFGYWLVLVMAALGVVVFFASLNDASADRPGDLNPWIAALGGLAAVVAAAGPLLPEGQAVISDNWYLVDGVGEPPAMLLTMRLVQLAILGIVGVIGFLSVRRWGLGIAIGVSVPALWLTISTLFDLTNRPVGPGFRNPGATDMHVHGVTIIGMSALGAMSMLAVVAAVDQYQRR